MVKRVEYYVVGYRKRAGQLEQAELRLLDTERKAAILADKMHRRSEAVAVYALECDREAEEYGEPDLLVSYGRVPDAA